MKKIPEAVGPYSAFRKAGDFLYISGQIAINPENQQIEAVTVEEQARQVLENLKAILENNGLTTKNVINKVTAKAIAKPNNIMFAINENIKPYNAVPYSSANNIIGSLLFFT